MKNSSNQHQNQNSVRLCLLALFLFGACAQVFGGTTPMPLEAHLDLAQHVVVGELTQMQETDEERGDGVRCGRATVTVRETLKGPPEKTISFGVIRWVAPDYGGASSPRVHKIGDSGIWLVKPDRFVSHTCGLLPESRRNDVQRILKSLAQRKLSEEVNGLKAWASVVRPHYGHTNPVIIFAVKNCSEKDVWCPVASAYGVVTVTATREDSQVFQYVLGKGRKRPVYCRKMSPGETAYMHPSWSFIDLARQQKLGPGKYTVVVSYENDREGEASAGPGKRQAVHAWRGKLDAPSVQLVLPEKTKNEQAAQQGAGAGR